MKQKNQLITINALKVYGKELNYLIEKYEKILKILRIFYINFACKINELNFALIHNIKENYDINYFNLDDLEKINQYDIKNLSTLNNNKFFLYENDENENNNSKYDKRLYIKKMMRDLKTIYEIELTNIHKYLYIKDEKYTKLYDIKSFKLLFQYQYNNKDNIKYIDNNENFSLIDDNIIKIYKHKSFELLFEYKLDFERKIYVNYIEEDDNIIISLPKKVIIYGIDYNNQSLYIKHELFNDNYSIVKEHIEKSPEFLAFYAKNKKDGILYVYDAKNQYIKMNEFNIKYFQYFLINNNYLIVLTLKSDGKYYKDGYYNYSLYSYNLKNSSQKILLTFKYIDFFYSKEKLFTKAKKYIIIKIPHQKYYFINNHNQIISVFSLNKNYSPFEILEKGDSLSYIKYSKQYIIIPKFKAINTKKINNENSSYSIIILNDKSYINFFDKKSDKIMFKDNEFDLFTKR